MKINLMLSGVKEKLYSEHTRTVDPTVRSTLKKKKDPYPKTLKALVEGRRKSDR